MEMIEKLSLAGIVPVIKVEDAADAVYPFARRCPMAACPLRRSRSARMRLKKPFAACMPSCPM